ncbi:MAG TPA: hypothetical protein VL356_05105 [Acidocella sp.]|nr:hypothetical protein [Acidocella sp.]
MNKKKQKIDSGPWALSATQNQAQLSQKFLRRFFQTAATFFVEKPIGARVIVRRLTAPTSRPVRIFYGKVNG